MPVTLHPGGDSAQIVERVIFPGVPYGDAFQAALPGTRRVFASAKRRLKALPGGDPGQDWLPHNLCRQFAPGKVSGIGHSCRRVPSLLCRDREELSG